MSYKFRGLTFDEFKVGDVHETASRTLTEADVVSFAGISGDFNPLHTNEEFGKKLPFGGRIAHGMLVASVATGLANQLGIFEGTSLAVLGMEISWPAPTKFGDTIRLVLTVTEMKESSKGDKGVITYRAEVKNQRDETVMDGNWKVLMRK